AILLPLIVLVAFALLQTVPFQTSAASAGGIPDSLWNAVSADPLATRFFVLQLLALVLTGALLFRYGASEKRTQTLIHVIIGIAVISALFGILRQTTQHSPGFGLPLIKPDQGYGQFINNNHFAFLMEMGFGLVLGLVAGRGVRRERGLIYLGALLPIWTALVLSNSRGGLIAMLAQVVSAALLFTVFMPASIGRTGRRRSLVLLHSLPARVVMIAVLVLGVVIGTLWLGGDRLASKIEEGHEFDTATAEVRSNARRNQIWKATWQMFAAHPIAGVGMAGYWAAIPTFHDASGTMTPQEAHNDYLELLASGGIIGFACGLWFIVVVFRKTREKLRNSVRFRRAACLGATLGIIGVAVHSLVDFGLHMMANALVFTALIVLATSLPQTERSASQ
ncbi:MAG: O-antigen ligase family protein, partial [Pyrinomonadaceae bacterium]